MFFSSSEIKDILKNTPVGYKSRDDAFFITTNKICIPAFKKLGVINHADEEKQTKKNDHDYIDCSAPGCFLTFENVSSYQAHYNSVHRYICINCNRSLPTPHLLDLHISEHHDSYFQTRVDRGHLMYACFLEECKVMMPNSAARKEHCIKIHNFPGNFRFDQVAGIKKRQKAKCSKMDMDITIEHPTIAQHITFNFGHSKERSFSNKCKKPSGSTLEDLSELAQALKD